MLSVKEELVVSREDLSAAVACFPNLTHLHLSDNSVETLNDVFLARLASSCPKLTRLHVGRSFAHPPKEGDVHPVKEYRRKEGHSITTNGLDCFFLKLLRLEELSLFCLHQATQLPDSFFQLKHLHTLVVNNAAALENPGFTNLTALTTLCVTFPWNSQHLSTLRHFPRLTHLSTVARHHNHQPAGAASVTLPSCLKLINFFYLCPEFDTIFPSASPFTGLEELLITQCRELENLPDDIGDLLPSLRKLTIRECFHLETLPESFTSLNRLEALIISISDAFSLPDNFGNLPALKLLVLEELQFRALPPSFCHLTEGPPHVVDISRLSHLRVLKLTCVGVRCGRVVRRRLSCLQQLEQLEMRLEGGRQELPVPLTFLPRLRSLLIEAPGIRRLPVNMAAALPQLRQLQLLSWSHKGLPSSIVELSSLTSLTVEAPQLKSLPQGMTSLVRLRKLELIRCNALRHLPESLTQLHQLILRNTSMLSLPANLVRLTEFQFQIRTCFSCTDSHTKAPTILSPSSLAPGSASASPIPTSIPQLQAVAGQWEGSEAAGRGVKLLPGE
ncbi:unnamed protein product [Closterium sp. Naga37s-1]|nr:unnamed protein product [Closterium sp. Naga37s-1]